MICVVITTVLAWVAIAKAQKVQVTFAGTPVDKKEFEAGLAAHKEKIDRLEAQNEKVWTKMEADRVEGKDRMAQIEGDLKAVRATTESMSRELGMMNLKLDNLKQ